VEPNDPDLLTSDEAARWLGISPGVFVRWVDAGRIPFHVGPGGDRLFRQDDLEAVTVRLKPDSEPDEPEPEEPDSGD
jgi:excisionase family DNA binding protein